MPFPRRVNISESNDHPDLARPSVPATAVANGRITKEMSNRSAERHIQTDHLLENLGHRAISSGFITGGAQVIRFGLNLGGVVILARLLTPQDFGLVAMTAAVMSVLRVFREGGLSTATIQREGITQAQVSNLFWINLALGGLITLVGVALSPVVARFYRDDRLVLITALLSCSFLVGSVTVQHLALLNRQMRYRTIAAIDIVSVAIGLLVGTMLAWRGFGYWALVGMQLATTIAEMVVTWVLSGWRPNLPRRGSGTGSLMGFGASMAVYIFLRRLAAGIDVILLGRLYGAEAVGFYSRGQALLFRPLDQFVFPFDAVFVPILSRLQLQSRRYWEVFMRLYGIVALLSFPSAGIIFGLSQPVVLLLLGQKWAGVIPIFAWLSLAALYVPISAVGMWPLTTQGRSRDLLVIGFVLPLLTVLSVVAGLPFGSVGVALTTSIVGLLIRLPVQFHIVGRSGPVTTRNLYGVFFRHLPLWGAVAAATWLAHEAVVSFPPIVQVGVGGLAGGAVAAGVIMLTRSLRREALFVIRQVSNFCRRPAEALT